MTKIIFVLIAWASSFCAQAQNESGRGIWTIRQANDWYQSNGWLVGSNFTPSNAINQLEFWQADTFDSARIDKELGWAESIGMNTMRVFLHDLLYEQDAEGFITRINLFLKIASRHHIRPLFVLFDSCWDPFPKLGRQRDPQPRVHNSGWVQSPGANALADSTQYPRLKKYVISIVGKFAYDERVLAWDVWNEPDNTNGGAYAKEDPKNKVQIINYLLPKVFEWARSVNPSQPLTAGIWVGDDWSSFEHLNSTAKIMISNSDIISFHNYDNIQEFEKRLTSLLYYNRPVICTEYMARPRNSTFQNTLPLAKKYNIGVYNWGFVQGKTQTNYPWDSWDKTYTSEPPVWFHDVFRTDGTPYRQDEVDLIKKLTSKDK